MKPRSIIVATLAITAIAIGTWTSYRIMMPPPSPRTATVLPAAGELPDFSLLDHDGNSIGPGIFAGQWDLVFFGFTHCPDICPLTLQLLASARQQLAEAGQQPLPRIVLVSVDPERDTPDIMGQYVRYFGTETLGITGELDEIRKLTKGLGIYFEKAGSDPDDYSVDHSAVVLLIDPLGRLHALFGAPHDASNYVHDLPIIMQAAKFPVAEAPLVASGIEIARPTPESKMAAGYLALRNNSQDSITITDVTSPNYASVEMHETIIEDGVSRMRPVDAITIPPGRVFYFKPGGKHLMLTRPVGQSASVTLEFLAGDEVALAVSVPAGD
ncbi:MAG: copper chaperone PCu(A)C [Woeseiaceae bacterium]|nr:copper chaperone PCu(A)C [Woeseiaceae bacterium]